MTRTDDQESVMSELPINQIALSVRSVQHSQRWYRDIFGYDVQHSSMDTFEQFRRSVRPGILAMVGGRS